MKKYVFKPYNKIFPEGEKYRELKKPVFRRLSSLIDKDKMESA